MSGIIQEVYVRNGYDVVIKAHTYDEILEMMNWIKEANRASVELSPHISHIKTIFVTKPSAVEVTFKFFNNSDALHFKLRWYEPV